MLRRALRSSAPLLLLLFALAAGASAQDARPLEISDYHTWQSIQGARISPDGGHVAWTYSKLRADGTLHVRRLSDGETTEVARGEAARFSDDGRWIAYEIAGMAAAGEWSAM